MDEIIFVRIIRFCEKGNETSLVDHWRLVFFLKHGGKRIDKNTVHFRDCTDFHGNFQFD